MPLFSAPDSHAGMGVLRAVAAGGGGVVELTHRGDDAHEIFAETARTAAEELPGVLLGAGSVRDAPTAARYVDAGAAFVVSPTFHEDVATLCNRRKVAYLPGCATPTEIARAEEVGCEIVKVFPADAAGGPELVRAVLGPSPWSRLMPTGGVEPTEASLTAWFAAGAAAVGMGSKLLPADAIRAGRWEELAANVRAARELVGRCRPAPSERWA